MILVFTTIHKKASGHKLGKGLLKSRLIACYNLVPVESAYWWKGKIEEENEVLMVLKAGDDNFDRIEDYINKNSGYEIPEVVAVKASDVNIPYLNWIDKETK